MSAPRLSAIQQLFKIVSNSDTLLVDLDQFLVKLC